MQKSCSPLIARVHRSLDRLELADIYDLYQPIGDVSVNITPYGNIREHYQPL